jgi:hypothetical protein
MGGRRKLWRDAVADADNETANSPLWRAEVGGVE